MFSFRLDLRPKVAVSPRDICWFVLLVGLLMLAAPRPLGAQEVTGAEVNSQEHAAFALVSQNGPGGRLVIAAVRPSQTDRFLRPAGKATVKKMPTGDVVIIGGYWKEDPALTMPGGRMFAVRDGGGIRMSFTRGLMIYSGSARVVANNEKLADFLPMLPGSVIRFIGPITFEGCAFDGSEADPLSFGFVEGVGLVYLRGSGNVTLQDGQALKLGSN